MELNAFHSAAGYVRGRWSSNNGDFLEIRARYVDSMGGTVPVQFVFCFFLVALLR